MKSQFPGSFYKSLFDNMVDGLAYCKMIYDESGNPVDYVYIKVNDNFEKLTGLKGVTGKKATDIIPTIRESNPELFKVPGRVVATGKPERFETCIEPLAIWLSVSAYRLKKDFVVGVFQNITAQKLLQKNLENAKIAARNVYEDLEAEKEKLAQAKAKDEALLGSIGEGIVAVDQDGSAIVVNKVAEDLLELAGRELMGKSFVQALCLEDERGNRIPDAQKPMILCMTTLCKIAATNAYYFVRKDGTKFPVMINATPVLLDAKPMGAIIVFRDITKEKEIDKAKTEFVSLASHQLRTPLSTVNWYAEMLLSGDAGKLNKEQKKYLEEIYKGNQRMVVLVNALLNVSRLELGTFLIEPEPVNVVELAQSAAEEQKIQIDERKIQFFASFGKDIPLVRVDSKLLRMVLQNLLSNAIRYTPEEGTVNLGLYPVKRGMSVDKQKIEEDSVAIVVSDAGCGIPKNQQDKIFTKLFRADNVREKNTEGTGLGLYIAKSIIDGSGGKIWFKSEEGKGTEFYVILPIAGMKKKKGAAAPPLR